MGFRIKNVRYIFFSIGCFQYLTLGRLASEAMDYPLGQYGNIHL